MGYDDSAPIERANHFEHRDRKQAIVSSIKGLVGDFVKMHGDDIRELQADELKIGLDARSRP